MRLRKPIRAIIDQVRITREGNDAILDYANSAIAGTRLTVGPDIATMTDREIIDVFNGILAAQEQLLAAWDKTVRDARAQNAASLVCGHTVRGESARPNSVRPANHQDPPRA